MKHYTGDSAIPNEHDISECWHPHLHASPFKNESAVIFYNWHKKEYADCAWECIFRPAPLCVFAGASFTPYVHTEHANGTYAVCPTCKEVMMCGWSDRCVTDTELGLSPTHCRKCNTELKLSDYFQPIFNGSRIKKINVIDPKCDPALTIAEACALSNQGIPIINLDAVVAILTHEGLLKTGDAVDDFSIGSIIQSEKLRYRRIIWNSGWTHDDALPVISITRITGEGSAVLRTRSITPLPGAKKRMRELLAMSRDKLQALALKKLANAILEK